MAAGRGGPLGEKGLRSASRTGRGPLASRRAVTRACSPAIVMTQNRVLSGQGDSISGGVRRAALLDATSIALVVRRRAWRSRGCSNHAMFDRDSYSEAVFEADEAVRDAGWARSANARNVNLGPRGPVRPRIWSAPMAVARLGGSGTARRGAGACAAPAAASLPPRPAADGAAGRLPGRSDLRPRAAPARARRHRARHDRMRGGAPRRPAEQCRIGAGESGERRVVLTYLCGPVAGHLHFRCRPAERRSTPRRSRKSPPSQAQARRRSARRAKTAQSSAERVYVQ